MIAMERLGYATRALRAAGLAATLVGLVGCASAPVAHDAGARAVPSASVSHPVPQAAAADDPIAQWLAGQHTAPAPPDDDKRTEVLAVALAYVGVPYRRGGSDYADGVDCSGFVQVAFRDALGVRLPRTASEQAEATRPIDPAALAAGDLVFFNTLGRPYSHVGIYVGQGRFVHSPRAGARVRLERMDSAYWRNRFDGARRIDLAPNDLQARADGGGPGTGGVQR